MAVEPAVQLLATKDNFQCAPGPGPRLAVLAGALDGVQSHRQHDIAVPKDVAATTVSVASLEEASAE